MHKAHLPTNNILQLPVGRAGGSFPEFSRAQARNRLTELSLGDCSPAQLELLLGCLQCVSQGSKWITWVQAPAWARPWLNEAQQLQQLRLVHRSTDHGVFYLMYLSIQAANSSWVVGPAQGLTFRERELLELAAAQNDCRLLLVREPAQH